MRRPARWVHCASGRAALDRAGGMAFAVLGVLGLLAPAPARAWCRMTTESTGFGCSTEGEPLAWRRRCIALAVDRELPDGLDEALVRRSVDFALAAWSGADCPGGEERVQIVLGRDRRPATCQQAEFSLEDGNVSVVALLDDWAERDLDPLAYALTTVWHDRRTGEVLDADIMVNATRGPYAWCPEATGCLPEGGAPAAVDLPNTLTHEVGHVLGLSHSEVPEATMAGEAPRGEVRKRSLEEDDRAGLCAAYPPGSLPEDCDFTPFGGFDLDCVDEPEPDGCSCRVDGRGDEPSVFLLGVLLLWVGSRRRRRTR